MFQVNSARNIEHLSMNRQKKIDRNIFLKVFLTRSRQSPLYDFKNTGNRPALLLNKGENVAPDYIRVLYICTVFQNLPQMEAYPKAFLEGAENLSLAL